MGIPEYELILIPIVFVDLGSGSVILLWLSGSWCPDVRAEWSVLSFEDVISLSFGFLGSTTRTMVSWTFLEEGLCVGMLTGQPWF